MRFQTNAKRRLGSGAVAALLAAAVTLGMTAAPAHAALGPPTTITNPFSAFDIDANGAYGPAAGEWSDITPAWFISTPAGATPVAAGNPAANSLLFAAVSQGVAESVPELYLMYDYLPRTVAPSQPNEFLGSVSFPIDIVRNNVSTPTNITVTVQTIPTFPTVPAGSSSFVVLIDLHDGQGPQPHPELDFDAGVGLGTTPAAIVGTGNPLFTTLPHELLELGIPLDLPVGFATSGPLNPTGDPKSGGDGTGYSPAPAFWGSDLPDNAGDPPASGGLFQIMPNGSTLIHPASVFSPEPTTLGLLGLGGMLLGVRRSRKSR